MNMFEQSRYFFNYVLPDIIQSNLVLFDNLLAQVWWIFFLLFVFTLLIYMNIFRKNVKLQSIFDKFNLFYQELSSKHDLKEIDLFLLKSIELVNAEFCAIYELRGETYILIESNAVEERRVSIPLRVGKKDLKRFKKSGSFSISYIISSSENNMIIFYHLHKIDLQKYYGYFDIMLTYYEEISQSFKSKGEGSLLNVSRDTSLSLLKLQMDKHQFFKFFIALVMKITKAKGVKLLTKEGESVFEYSPKKSVDLQKVFYIRNTPYKLEFYDDKTLAQETVTQVGSFLDMAGSFLVNSDKNSEIVQNYLSLLTFTNEALELENIYYKHHSLIVKTVSVEIAKFLFLAENEIDTIALGATLHDIGMIGDLLAVLDKDVFGETEKNLIKEHPLIGSILVEPISHIYPILDIVKYHHERYDGKGYPLGLKESQIPLNAQIVSLGEFYAGITGDRSYKVGKTHEEAVAEIINLKEKMFSRVVVDAFVDVEKSLKVKIDKIKAKKDESREASE